MPLANDWSNCISPPSGSLWSQLGLSQWITYTSGWESKGGFHKFIPFYFSDTFLFLYSFLPPGIYLSNMYWTPIKWKAMERPRYQSHAEALSAERQTSKNSTRKGDILIVNEWQVCQCPSQSILGKTDVWKWPKPSQFAMRMVSFRGSWGKLWNVSCYYLYSLDPTWTQMIKSVAFFCQALTKGQNVLIPLFFSLRYLVIK